MQQISARCKTFHIQLYFIFIFTMLQFHGFIIYIINQYFFYTNVFIIGYRNYIRYRIGKNIEFRRHPFLYIQRRNRIYSRKDNVVNFKNTLFSIRISHSQDRKSTRLNSSHVRISYAVFCLKKKTKYKYRYTAPPTNDSKGFRVVLKDQQGKLTVLNQETYH